MPFGLRIRNPAGELVIADDAQGLVCMHKATAGAVVQPTGTATGSFPGRVMGYQTHTSTHNGPILCAVDLPLGRRVGIIDVTGSAGAWSIKSYCGDTPDSNGFDVQYALDVWVFGFPPGPPHGYGMALRDGSTLKHDLSLPNPLYPRANVTIPLSPPGGGIAIPALTRPVAVGCASGERIITTVLGVNTHADTFTRQFVHRIGSIAAPALTVTQGTDSRYQYFGPDPSGNDRDDFYTTVSFIIEGSLLP
jgi:hypothetical protein